MDRVDLNGGLSWCARWHLCAEFSLWMCTQEPTIGNVHSTCAVSLAFSRSSTTSGGVVTCSLAGLCAASLHLQQQSTVCLCTIVLWGSGLCSCPAPSWATCPTLLSSVTASGCTLPLSTNPIKRMDVGRRGVLAGGSSFTWFAFAVRLGVCAGTLCAVSRSLVMHTAQ